jgi:diguanylate cyclase (GGDEF)-like protein/PAS domain S-box-containing protein
MPFSDLKIFQQVFMQSWNAIVITDADPALGYLVQQANPAFCAMTGYTINELRGRTLKMLQGPDTDPEVIARLRQCLKEARYFEGSTINYRKDGSSYPVRWNISPVRDDDGNLTHFVSVQQDLSDIDQAERHSRLLAHALDAAGDPVLVTDTRSHIIFANAAFAELTGYQPEELLGKTPALFQSGQHDQNFYDELHQSLSSGHDFLATFVNRKRDGTVYHAEQNISPILDEHGHITHYVSVGRDVSERIKLEEELRSAATVDPLTGLYTRRHGENLMQEAIAKSVRSKSSLSVILCDIDHFKAVNDNFGHATGDRVLAQISRVIRQSSRSSDSVIRWGGEEFLVLLPDCSEAVAMDIGERIRQTVENLTMPEVGRITVSMGLATLKNNEEAEALLLRADKALYAAKNSGRNRLLVSAEQASTR